MAEFRIITRGEGLKEALRRGYPPAELLLGRLDLTPEPLLEPDQLERLKVFLRTAPPRASRRTIRQREDAQELSRLIRCSNADALTEEAKTILVDCVEGKLTRRKGRPNKVVHLMGDDAVLPGLAAELAYALELRLQEGGPLEIPEWGLIKEDPASSNLPLKTRALTIAQKALRERGFHVPSLARLRNRISERNVALVEYFVNHPSSGG
jgi:hypothetical protein